MRATLEDGGVSIKLLGSEDADRYVEMLLRNRGFLQPYDTARPDDFWTAETQRNLLEQAAAEAADGTGYAFGIYDLRDGELAGRVALSNVVRKAWQNTTLGYWVDQARNGRGLATGAARLAVRFAFEDAGLHRVQAGVMPRNAGSIRVLENIGMRYEGLSKRYLLINGVWEDHRIYAITGEEWAG
ncbi:MAG: GNAT family N-acetyltransferase [Actinomycetota bacterium]